LSQMTHKSWRAYVLTYKNTIVYIAVVVTLIFLMQVLMAGEAFK
jgi:hypothetical protein